MKLCSKPRILEMSCQMKVSKEFGFAIHFYTFGLIAVAKKSRPKIFFRIMSHRSEMCAEHFKLNLLLSKSISVIGIENEMRAENRKRKRELV